MGLPVARLGDTVAGISSHYGPPIFPATVGVPLPLPVNGTITVNPVGLPTDVPVLVGGAPVAYEGASGFHMPAVCLSPVGTAAPSLDPPLGSFKTQTSLATAPLLINGKKVLVSTSVTQHCYDIAPVSTALASVGTITSGSSLLML